MKFLKEIVDSPFFHMSWSPCLTCFSARGLNCASRTQSPIPQQWFIWGIYSLVKRTNTLIQRTVECFIVCNLYLTSLGVFSVKRWVPPFTRLSTQTFMFNFRFIYVYTYILCILLLFLFKNHTQSIKNTHFKKLQKWTNTMYFLRKIKGVKLYNL